jgi:heptose I phosphotransferase
MISPDRFLMLAAVCLLGAVLTRRLRRPRGGFVAFHPDARTLFGRLGLKRARDFLELSGPIVAGHRDRNVTRVVLGSGSSALVAFLKREHRVPWTVRLLNALAGFGFTSLSLREARVLQTLAREGIGCPEWLAAGEDGEGRAFLLLREVRGAWDLRSFLASCSNPTRRRQMARALGKALAQLHRTGFGQPDLYPKHVLIHPETGAIHFLDWQRSRRRSFLSWKRRERDLAALHAALPPEAASRRERLIFLLSYLEATRAMAAPNEGTTPSGHLFATRLEAATGQLLRRRHVREKRQAPLPGRVQEWTPVEEEGLCVTPALARLWPGRTPDWLTLARQPVAPLRAVTRRWFALPEGRRTLLIHRQRGNFFHGLWSWARRHPLVSPEQRQAALLFRLQRHAVTAPRVLALGQRPASPWRQESFLLTETPGDAVSLETWLHRRCQPPKGDPLRRAVLHEVGILLHRLHEVGCYLGRACPLGIRLDSGPKAEVVVESVERVVVRRQGRPGHAAKDLANLRRRLVAAGCPPSDWACVLAGYENGTPAAEAPEPPTYCPDWTYQFPDVPTLEGSSVMPPGPPAPEIVPPSGGLWRRLVQGARQTLQRPAWSRFAGTDWADHIMERGVTDRFHAKQGRSVGRLILDAAEGGGRLAVYLKRHHRLSRWRGLLAALWPGGAWSPAWQEWEHLEWARCQGFPVPLAVAAAEYIGPWGRLQSVLAVEELADMLPLHEAIPLAQRELDAASFRRWKAGLVREVARLARLLHDRRRFHKDLYLCHFYVPRADVAALPADWRGRVHLIDLHRLGRHRWTSLLWQLKDLAQLLYSSEIPGIDVRDRLLFWRAYRSAGTGRFNDRLLRWGVLFKWRRYRRHNERRRARAEGLSSANGRR